MKTLQEAADLMSKNNYFGHYKDAADFINKAKAEGYGTKPCSIVYFDKQVSPTGGIFY